MTDLQTRPNVDRYIVETQERWRERTAPPVRFPSTWDIEMRMPFGRAQSRFIVTNDYGVRVSVYFDDSDALGCVGEPYWEFMPIGGILNKIDDDEPERYLAGQEAKMIAAIAKLGDPVRGAAISLGADPDQYDASGGADHGDTSEIPDD